MGRFDDAPNAKKIGNKYGGSFSIVERNQFALTNQLAHITGMLNEFANCKCGVVAGGTREHWCCGGCRNSTFVREGHFGDGRQGDNGNDGHRGSGERILPSVKFDPDRTTACKQMLGLMRSTISLAIYAYARGQHIITRGIGMPVFFFASMDYMRAYASHLVHAQSVYASREQSIANKIHQPLSFGDLYTVSRVFVEMAANQVNQNDLQASLLMGYVGGGVGIGYVDVAEPELRKHLANDLAEAEGRVAYKNLFSTFAIYLFDQVESDVQFEGLRLLLQPVPLEADRRRSNVNLWDPVGQGPSVNAVKNINGNGGRHHGPPRRGNNWNNCGSNNWGNRNNWHNKGQGNSGNGQGNYRNGQAKQNNGYNGNPGNVNGQRGHGNRANGQHGGGQASSQHSNYLP